MKNERKIFWQAELIYKPQTLTEQEFKMYFEDIGFRYLGPVDGHNIEKLEDIFKICKEQEGPILVHVLTKKGKGYKPAEVNPDRFHSTVHHSRARRTPLSPVGWGGT